MWTTAKTRQFFLDYFSRNEHKIVPSSGLVPRNDPTLLFTNAGMVQFKNIFTGAEKSSFSRAATAQKCIRAGGKHNDLENVGHTARHHTFFEMLGNFSFGDYFKDRAIELAWNLVTKEFGIDAKRLLVTVYIDDDEAAKLWKKIAGLSDDRILRIAGSDNFWAMGETGPCGPCSEIFFDHGDKIQGGPPGTPEADGDRFVEIWNLVFMQYEDAADTEGAIKRLSLPKPSIDTGMGLERVSAVLQGVHDNYDIDLFKNIIQVIAEESKVAYQGPQTPSHRVIADHLRSTSFLVAEGVTPSNEGRGYVLRRIMRRAMRHAYLMGQEEPFIYRLVPTLINEMGEAYPELTQARAFITETIKLEEERFLKTLGRGLKLLEEESKGIAQNGSLAGAIAFKLYDTYGFPIDLTEDVLKSRGISVEMQGYEKAMEHQRQEARAAWVGSGEQKTDRIWFDVFEKTGPSEFLGYTTHEAQGIVQALVLDNKSVPRAQKGDMVHLISNQTPFYAESGGQVGDTGIILSEKKASFEVVDTFKRADGLFVHKGIVKDGSFEINDTVTLKVDAERRTLLRSNHSATHLLHAVLRKHLGTHVVQKGSLVAPDRLRFDFSYPTPLSKDLLQSIEDEVNFLIRRNTDTVTHVMSPEEAQHSGALALFGEKYGETVRVVFMGAGDQDKSYSIEFCGGTHVHHTGDIGYFKIISESGVAAGIRRIEALTGKSAEQFISQRLSILDHIATSLKVTPDKIIERIEALREEQKKLERSLKELREKRVTGGSDDGDIKIIAGIKLVSHVSDETPAGELKPIVDQLKKKVGSGVVVVGSSFEGKASIVVGITDDLTSKLDAVKFVRLVVPILGGKGGGGRPDLAQAGGPETSKISTAISAIEKALAEEK
ncbi:alanine--tRNA ligase [Candidatus Nucleicultrix amoebiphila]|jgi:alanyl-tRNA synthetase|uniref:Alanine--tRNA ligase n=1 Tax=Candidatus Nucleicultrix amoebiphila FS5 TaxID=1414854 RepID=A0A1W6N474_9PROT|nr:alanine--tRNA ligase [Candidatus Nucleicultrix amoebiphila]ARN84680.1 alanyl-tRNA synthetase [Candidatus Nucleicultrix amoebiphila FS5]